MPHNRPNVILYNMLYKIANQSFIQNEKYPEKVANIISPWTKPDGYGKYSSNKIKRKKTAFYIVIWWEIWWFFSIHFAHSQAYNSFLAFSCWCDFRSVQLLLCGLYYMKHMQKILHSTRKRNINEHQQQQRMRYTTLIRFLLCCCWLSQCFSWLYVLFDINIILHINFAGATILLISCIFFHFFTNVEVLITWLVHMVWSRSSSWPVRLNK